jgi:spermidine synthase
MIRAKPADGSYGCYGHIRGFIHDREFRNLLRKGLKERGFYILQVEQAPFVVTDLNTQNQYNVIHRIFISLGRSETGKARHNANK